MTSSKRLDLKALAPHRVAAESARTLLIAVRRVLGDAIVAVWFDGSVALGAFDPTRSDIDLVVLVDELPSGEVAAAVRAAHMACARAAAAWGEEIETVYVSPAALRTASVRLGVPHLYVERGGGGDLRAAPLDPSWLVHLRVLRQHGLSIAGPRPADLVEAVSDDELKCLAAWIAVHKLTPDREHPANLVGLGGRVYLVLTMCRLCYTLRTGQVVSKMTAARWALGIVPPALAPEIEGAMAWRKDSRSSANSTVEGALALIDWTQEQCRAGQKSSLEDWWTPH